MLNLRRQLRSKNYLKTEKFYCGLMENPDTKTFYTLIKMNQSNRSDSATCFIVNGRSILVTVTQRTTLKIYYEDLAVPKEDICFDDDSKLHLELIHELNTQGSLMLQNHLQTVN